MKITTTRKISQGFFFILFIWLIIVNSIGESFWQIRGWPVNFFLNIDPLTAITTILSTHSLYKGLIWSVVIIIGTILVGRFFCSWLCPFGTLHNIVSWLGHRNKSIKQKIELNKFRKAHNIKYIILILFLIMAAIPFSYRSIQTGLLDPIPLFTRSVSIILLPIIDSTHQITSAVPRYYEGAFIILAIFIVLTLLNLIIPRFFCRFLCPLGAFLAVLSRFAIFRIGHNENKCLSCNDCEKHCQGGCEPGKEIKHSECLLCFNCRDDCIHDTISYQTEKSQGGEITGPPISRKAFITTLGTGIFLIPAVRLSGMLEANWQYKIIRPPGSCIEEEFLRRCIKCGQCMRICPTNIIQPGKLSEGLENLWTPNLNFRIGTSGCQYNCTACGQVCPTGAIRPITINEKQGLKKFKKEGPIRMGTAFFDRNRCLPWAKKIPCIVCQENCPVSPKAIYTDEHFETIRDGIYNVISAENNTLELANAKLKPEAYATGDYYVFKGKNQFKIKNNTSDSLTLEQKNIIKNGDAVTIKIKLQRPFMDIEKCIGCGICEHECPVSGLKAVRISAEGESRDSNKTMLL
jgi:polyferredoxin/formate hydrogenlyase subunit 6/NADH:ubiquinone oxidoreductase subunit I